MCGERLALTRLRCDACETEVSGSFEACEFCGLGPEERTLLLVFLRSRGNMKELERHLGVSYPTARARFDQLLASLGLEQEDAAASEVGVLEALARGDIDVDEAMRRIR